MRVRMTTKIGGYRNGEEWPAPGGVIDVPDHEAADLIAARYAKEVDDDGDDTTDEPEVEEDGTTDDGGPDATGEPEGDTAEESDGEPTDGPVADDTTCPTCGFTAKTAAGLASHQRKHEDD